MIYDNILINHTMATLNSPKGGLFTDDSCLSTSVKSDLAADKFEAENVFKPQTQSRLRRQGVPAKSAAPRRRRVGRPDLASNFWRLESQFGSDDPGKLLGATSIAICPNHNVAVLDSSTKTINVYGRRGKFKHSFKVNQGPNIGKVSFPRHIAVNREGVYFVTDETQWIKRFSPKGDFEDEFAVIVPQLKTPSDIHAVCPVGLTIDVNGRLLVGEVNNKYVCRHTPDGTYVNNFKVSMEPVFLAVTPAHQVLICACQIDSGNRKKCFRPTISIHCQ